VSIKAPAARVSDGSSATATNSLTCAASGGPCRGPPATPGT
jgi:hypothetical protein